MSFYLIAMVVLAWSAVITGAYIIYPWYRTIPPHDVTNLADYPQAFLKSSPLTSEWHNLGMEWKENVAWLAPISMSMVAYVTVKYGTAITKHRQLRLAILSFCGVYCHRNRRCLRRVPEQVCAGERRYPNRPVAWRIAMSQSPVDKTTIDGLPAVQGPRQSWLPASAAPPSALWRSCVMPLRQSRSWLNFYNPSGPLSSVTTVAVIIWLGSWLILNQRWRSQKVDLSKVNLTAFTLHASASC